MTARLPDMDQFATVEVNVVVVVEVGATVPPTVTEAQLIVPRPAIVAAVLVAAAFWRVMAPLTVRVAPEATVRELAVALALLNVTEATVLAGVALTVTASPARIVIVSPAAGTPLGLQVLAVFQSVLPVLVLAVAALAVEAPRSKPSSVRSERAVSFFI